ncbi:hypothetical protein [uncultured Clostridium sp.]|nr:hypothetical protein [uncultured Clostridium sp.]
MRKYSKKDIKMFNNKKVRRYLYNQKTNKLYSQYCLKMQDYTVF